MPHVRKADVLNVVRQLWGSTGVLEDEAKLVLAERLINEVWEGNKAGLPLNQAGGPIKAALGDRWLSSHERTAAGKPLFGAVLAEDPYFVLKNVSQGQPNVQLRMSRLAQLISNPELISEYRKPAASSGSAAGVGGAGSSGGGGKAPAGPAAVTLTDEGLPIRPGEPVCQHYMKHGWCLFKQDCWYSHPPDRAGRRNTGQEESQLIVQSHLEPDVWLRGGVYPIRPKAKVCAFYAKNGWCYYKAHCRNHHPALDELPNLVDNFRRPSPVPDQPVEALVKQPPTQLLLGVLLDAVYPPRSGKEAFVKGQVARHILDTQMQPGDINIEDKVFNIGGAAVGNFITRWWPSQTFYDSTSKPYTKLDLLFKDDPFFKPWVAANGTPMVAFMFGHLIDVAGQLAAQRLCAMADAVWPPGGGKEVWLRGMLAKWLMNAGFIGDGPEGSKVLRAVLAIGPESATVFRIEMGQAGEFLKRSWEMQPHPYDRTSRPWDQLKHLIAGDRFLYIEPDPQKPSAQHITLDIADMLQNFPTIARAAHRAQHGSGSVSSAANGAGSSRDAASSTAGASSTGGTNEMALDFDDDDSPEELFARLSGSSWPTPAAAAAAGPSSSAAAAARGHQAGGSSSRSSNMGQQQRGTSSAGGAPSLAEAEADLAALEALTYEAPEIEWWWPDHKPEHASYVWTEVAIRLLDPSVEDFELQLAEMVQHLEICQVMAMACATYKSHPHLLQFFAPHAAVGGIELPAAVYLVDVMKPGPHISQLLELVRPVLASTHNTKVCHGSKLWSGQLEKAFKIRLGNYYDTQQANYVEKCLRLETGRSNQTFATIKNTADVSLSALLRSYEFYHPVRHHDREAPLVWQDRPLNDELTTCAAADVVYLLPLMEAQLRSLRIVAAEVRQHQQSQRPGSRAAALLSSLPPELSDTSALAAIAAGAEERGGGLSYDRLRQLGSLEAFHQVPLHGVNLSLHQSYGALRGRPVAR